MHMTLASMEISSSRYEQHQLIVTKSIINQANSWAELSVTLNAFQAIFSRHNISAAYISYVRAFGYRVKDEECSRSTYYWKIDPTSGSEGELTSLNGRGHAVLKK
jgi:hypothetical protein